MNSDNLGSNENIIWRLLVISAFLAKETKSLWRNFNKTNFLNGWSGIHRLFLFLRTLLLLLIPIVPVILPVVVIVSSSVAITPAASFFIATAILVSSRIIPGA